MKPTMTNLLRLAAVAAAVAAAPALAQTSVKATSSAPEPTPTAKLATPDSKTMATYKQTTWRKHETTLKGGGTSREIPPTDCPPLPAQDCLDTWKIKIINPWE